MWGVAVMFGGVSPRWSAAMAARWAKVEAAVPIAVDSNKAAIVWQWSSGGVAVVAVSKAGA